MKKTTIIAALFLTSAFAIAQTGRVGINTETPQTTLDVSGKKDSNGNLLTSDVTGLQAPRLTRAELTAKGNTLYTPTQKGALVYITDISAGDATLQRVNITSPGYYYFDGALWQKMIDTDTVIEPTGFERLPNMIATDFHWRLIGATAANYGTEGKYGLDATWNPADLNETIDVAPALSYNAILGLAGLTTADLGAKGKNSFTAGAINSAFGNLSTALGGANLASGHVSFAAGALNKSTGRMSASIGNSNVSSAQSSFAAGDTNEASGASSVAMGNANKASGENAVALGQANTASKQGAVALGNTSTASEISALAMGQASTASGQASLAIGTQNTASAQNAVAIGRLSNASGQSSIAIGTVGNEAKGLGSISVGNNTVAESAYTTAMGLYNTLETSPEPLVVSDATKRLFVIGNGNATTRNDALTILRNGKTGISASTPTETLDVGKGNVRVREINSNPSTDPTDKYVMADADGVLKVASLFVPKTSLIGLRTTATANIGAGTIAPVVFTNNPLLSGFTYNTTTGVYTAENAGYYQIATTVAKDVSMNNPTDGTSGVRLLVNGTVVNSISNGYLVGTQNTNQNMTYVVYLNAGDTFNINTFYTRTSRITNAQVSVIAMGG